MRPVTRLLRSAWTCTVKDDSNNTQLQLTDDGNLGVGEKPPEVAGQVKITGGSPGAGKVLEDAYHDREG